jgi:ethanolamine utilization protein EutN
MKLCKVIGFATASLKSEGLSSLKRVVLKKINDDGNPVGESFLAVDTFGTGLSEMVAVTAGYTATNALDNTSLPIDAAVVGIIDHISIDKKIVYKK